MPPVEVAAELETMLTRVSPQAAAGFDRGRPGAAHDFWLLGCAARWLGRPEAARTYFLASGRLFVAKTEYGRPTYDAWWPPVMACLGGMARRLAGAQEEAAGFLSAAHEGFGLIRPELYSDWQPGGPLEHTAYGYLMAHWAYAEAAAGQWEQARRRAAAAANSYMRGQERGRNRFPQVLAWSQALAALAAYMLAPESTAADAALAALAALATAPDCTLEQRLQALGYAWLLQDDHPQLFPSPLPA